MAKLILQRLSTHPQFDATLKKYVNSDDLSQIQKVLNNIYNEVSYLLGKLISNKGKFKF